MKLKPQNKAKPALNKVQKDKPLNKPQKNNVPAQNIQKSGKGPLAANKKHAAPAKVLPPKKVVEEDEDDDSEDEEIDDLEGLLDLEAESDEEDDLSDEDEDGEDEDGEDEDGEEEDDQEDENDDNSRLEIDESEEGASTGEDEDDKPIEAPIVKAEKKAKKEKVPVAVAPVPASPAEGNIKIGLMPKNITFDRIIVVKNIPKTSKQKDLVAIFGKYGTIVHIQTSHDDGHKICLVAYGDANAARSALGENKKATIKDAKLHVTAQNKDAPTTPVKAPENRKSKEEYQQEIEANKDRTISLGHLAKGTNEGDIRKHFGGCGPIASIKVLDRLKKAFVVFANAQDVVKAKKLHQSILKDATITVRAVADGAPSDDADPSLKIVLKNTQHLKSIQVEKLRGIFSKCGEIADINILCGRDVLAFITFKQEKSVQKALKLNGTSSDGLEIEVDQCKPPGKNTTIIIHNLKPGATEADVRKHFAETGEIERVIIKPGFATVQFKNVDAFCKSFLLNESHLKGQLIFLEPFSAKKPQIVKTPIFGKRKHLPSKSENNGPAKKFKAAKGKRQNGV